MRTWVFGVAMAIGLGVAATAARADQCQWLDSRAVAERAAAALNAAGTALDYCEPCGDPAPGVPTAIGRAVARRDAAGGWRVDVDGRERDLAYVFVAAGEGRFDNLAALAGCPTVDVSPHLSVARATASGVLIAAASTAAAAPPPPAAPPTIATPTPAPVVVVLASKGPPPWSLALAGLALLVIGGAAGAWLAGHRRAVHRPRATDLVDRRGDRRDTRRDG